MEEKKTFTFDEAYEKTLEYFGGDELAARVWVNKYALKDSYGHIFESTPTDMHWRLAHEIARIESKYKNHSYATKFSISWIRGNEAYGNNNKTWYL